MQYDYSYVGFWEDEIIFHSEIIFFSENPTPSSSAGCYLGAEKGQVSLFRLQLAVMNWQSGLQGLTSQGSQIWKSTGWGSEPRPKQYQSYN